MPVFVDTIWIEHKGTHKSTQLVVHFIGLWYVPFNRCRSCRGRCRWGWFTERLCVQALQLATLVSVYAANKHREGTLSHMNGPRDNRTTIMYCAHRTESRKVQRVHLAHLSQHDNIRLPLTPSVDMHNSWAEWSGFILVTLRQETYSINHSVVDQVKIAKCTKTHLETYTNSSLSQLGRFGKTRKSDSLPLTA